MCRQCSSPCPTCPGCCSPLFLWGRSLLKHHVHPHFLEGDGADLFHIKRRYLLPDLLIFHLRGKDFLREEANCLIHLCKEKEQSTGSHRHLVPRHPNKQVPLGVSSMLRCHLWHLHLHASWKTLSNLQNLQQSPELGPRRVDWSHTWTLPIQTTHSPRAVQKDLERSQSLTRALSAEKRRRLAESLQLSPRSTWSTRHPVRTKMERTELASPALSSCYHRAAQELLAWEPSCGVGFSQPITHSMLQRCQLLWSYESCHWHKAG